MRNLDSCCCCCWRCMLCQCKVRNKFLVNFWNHTILLCIPCTFSEQIPYAVLSLIMPGSKCLTSAPSPCIQGMFFSLFWTSPPQCPQFSLTWGAGYHKLSLPTLFLWSSQGTKVYGYIIQPSTLRSVSRLTNSMSNKLQISVQKHECCNYELIFLLFSPPGLKHFWHQIVFRNLFRGLPVDLKT